MIRLTTGGHLGVVRYLVEECGGDVEGKDQAPWTPLHYAAANGRIEVVRYLREQAHADIEATNGDEGTPTHLAAWKGQVEVLKYLMEGCGANVEAMDKYGKRPIDMEVNEDVRAYLQQQQQQQQAIIKERVRAIEADI